MGTGPIRSLPLPLHPSPPSPRSVAGVRRRGPALGRRRAPCSIAGPRSPVPLRGCDPRGDGDAGCMAVRQDPPSPAADARCPAASSPAAGDRGRSTGARIGAIRRAARTVRRRKVSRGPQAKKGPQSAAGSRPRVEADRGSTARRRERLGGRVGSEISGSAEICTERDDGDVPVFAEGKHRVEHRHDLPGVFSRSTA